MGNLRTAMVVTLAFAGCDNEKPNVEVEPPDAAVTNSMDAGLECDEGDCNCGCGQEYSRCMQNTQVEHDNFRCPEADRCQEMKEQYRRNLELACDLSRASCGLICDLDGNGPLDEGISFAPDAEVDAGIVDAGQSPEECIAEQRENITDELLQNCTLGVETEECQNQCLDCLAACQCSGGSNREISSCIVGCSFEVNCE